MFGCVRSFWSRNFVQDAPAELSQCEFGCRATVCQHGAWESCRNRLLLMRREAALSPAAAAAAPAQRAPE